MRISFVIRMFHPGLAGGRVGFAVGSDHLLVDVPGGFDLDVVIVGEQRVEAGVLSLGQQADAGVDGPAGTEQRISRAAAVPVQGLLDASAALVHRASPARRTTWNGSITAVA